MSDTAPLVSVALITFRHRDYIADCLEAILAQDYPNLEVIVADDASDDGNREIIDEFAARHPGRLTVLPKAPNMGVTANHQRALDACTGKYVAWMSGDDLMLPGKVSAQVALMEADPTCAICYHDLDVFDSESGKTLYRSDSVDPPREGGMAVLARHGAFNLATSNMVRRSASPAFETRVPVASDWIYYVECLADGGTIRRLPHVLGRYRRHVGNITHSGGASQPRSLLADHLASCAILTARYPQLARALRYRSSRLLAQQRWEADGAHYGDWLRASLATRFGPDIALAWMAHRLSGLKR